jgi:hypothetical protein
LIDRSMQGTLPTDHREQRMLVFQDRPDVIFLAILHEALEYVRDVHLVRYRKGYRPTREERQELDESYGELFPDLAAFFTRTRLIRLIERLLRASRHRRRYRLTDYHWLVLHSCLRTYCDLHNDDATGTGDRVGPYEIEHIDLDAILDRFFFDLDFLMGPSLLAAEEKAPGQFGVSREAWKIAARLKPGAGELRLTPVRAPAEAAAVSEPERDVPIRGYVGPYPLREPDEPDADPGGSLNHGT